MYRFNQRVYLIFDKRNKEYHATWLKKNIIILGYFKCHENEDIINTLKNNDIHVKFIPGGTTGIL